MGSSVKTWMMAAVVAFCLGGCHESADTSVSTSAVITKAAGGSLSLADIQLIVPAEVLPADTEVSLEVIDRGVPDGLGIIGRAFRVGPPGLELRGPATVFVTYTDANLPQGTDPAALWLAYLTDRGVLESVSVRPRDGGPLVGDLNRFSDIVMVELQPRAVNIMECPVIDTIGRPLQVSIGSQVPGVAAPTAHTVILDTDFGAFSENPVTVSGGSPADVAVTSPVEGEATITATVDDTELVSSEVVELTAPRIEAALVRFETSLGTFDLRMLPDAAPRHVANFLGYVDLGFYDGTLIHRVSANPPVIQGGGFESGDEPGTMIPKVTCSPIDSEADDILRRSNEKYTVALALSGTDANSGTSQFFVNLDNNTFLDEATAFSPAFTVFAEVVSGMDVIDAISQVEVDGETPRVDVVVTAAFVVAE
jgi:cyclophilin family peptidyl-prolyl cis-trans isomerase